MVTDNLSSVQDQDDESIGSDTWNPTPVAFEAFLKRDFDHACRNVQMLMQSAARPVSLKELKESCLHSINMIEKVLASKIASKQVREEKGRYSLVRW